MNENILLVEDEHALRMTVGDRLRKQGYRVDCVGRRNCTPEGNFSALRFDDP